MTDSNIPQVNIEGKIDNLMAKMSLEEKVGQLNQMPMQNINQLKKLIREGKVGSVIIAATALAGNEKQQTAGLIERNEMQRIAIEESRLGIPILYGRDVIHGHRTVFPIPLAQAASWDPELVKKAASISAKEAFSDGVRWTFAPMMDISRDQRWGRIIEGFGEDPFLASEMAKAFITGFQGEDLSEPGSIAACAKHFVGYGAAEGGRDYNSTDISEYTLRNIYLKPFKAAVEAGVCTVMSSFNDIGGEPVTSNHYLLTEVLKKELGFDGFVVSDWNSVIQLENQGVAANRRDAAYLAFDAGVDMDMADGCYIEHIADLLREGKINTGRLDDAVRRILRIKLRLGLFKTPYADPDSAGRMQLLPEHISCSRKLASRGMVLLKNDCNLLPLPKKGIKIAVIGPIACAKRTHLGSWMLDGREEESTCILEGLKTVAPEAEILMSPSNLMDDMLQIARLADAVIVALGESWARTGESQNVADIRLSPDQEALLEVISQFNKNIVTVICAGRPLSLVKADRYSMAMLYSWHSGMQAGMAVADILFGDVNPSGKLPVTFPRSSGQIPLYYNHRCTGRPIDEYYGDSQYFNYHDELGQPLYPFGYGLSYTVFQYNGIYTDRKEIKSDEEITAGVFVTNTGKRAGEEIVQCYVSDLLGSVVRPVRELKGFKRIHLEPGETARVSFVLGRKDLSFYGSDGLPRLEPGDFTVWIGGNCRTDDSITFKVINY